jgi:hypothetical protein
MEREDFKGTFSGITNRRSARRKLDLLLRAYSLVGALTAILAGGYFLVTLLPYTLSAHQRNALLVVGIGITLAFMSRTLMILRKERDFEELVRMKEYESLASFLDAWARFERISKEVLAERGEDFNRLSLRSVISRLHEEGKINNADVLALEEALQTRNAIVHGERNFSSKLTEQITNSLIEIVKKIVLV